MDLTTIGNIFFFISFLSNLIIFLKLLNFFFLNIWLQLSLLIILRKWITDFFGQFYQQKMPEKNLRFKILMTGFSIKPDLN